MVSGVPAFAAGGGGGLGGAYLAYASPAGASNNVAPPGFGGTVGLLDVTLAGDANWTGLAAGANKQLLVIANADAVHTLTLNGLNGGSLAANQFRAGGDPVLPPLSALLLCYYTTAAQWIVV